SAKFFRVHNDKFPNSRPVLFTVHAGKNSFGIGITKDKGDSIEKINFSHEGTLVGYNQGGPIRKQAEFPEHLINVALQIRNECLDNLEKFSIKKENNSKLIDTILDLLNEQKTVLD